MIKKMYYNNINDAIKGAKKYGLACYQNVDSKIKMWFRYNGAFEIIYTEK
jgi:hypothetical protein